MILKYNGLDTSEIKYKTKHAKIKENCLEQCKNQ